VEVAAIGREFWLDSSSHVYYAGRHDRD